MNSPPDHDQVSTSAFHQAARESLQQLRIAGIAVSVGLCGFMVNRLNQPARHLVAMLSVIACVLAIAAGFLAWKFASRMFYAKAEMQVAEGQLAHCWKNIADTALWVLLVSAVTLAACHVFS